MRNHSLNILHLIRMNHLCHTYPLSLKL
jgi:hypothetical protein